MLQNTLLVLGLKACTINSSLSMQQYIASTVVVSTEVLKFVLSTCCCFIIDAGGDFQKFTTIIWNGFMEEGADVLKLCVPAILYAIQNNLQYIIEEAPLFLVLYQSKIITTALFYSTMLSKRLSIKEWGCVGVLTIGVSMAESSQLEIVPHHASNIVGIVSVIFACLSSGLAGVYFEKILKSSKSNIWMINMQMSLLSTFFCTSLALTQDAPEMVRHGLFYGYNHLVVLSIILQAFTGLAVALVVKYSDNIYKGFVHSLSLIVCNSLSSVLFDDTELNASFLLGCFVVLSSSWVYLQIPHGAVGINVNDNDSKSKSQESAEEYAIGFTSSASASRYAPIIREVAGGKTQSRTGTSSLYLTSPTVATPAVTEAMTIDTGTTVTVYNPGLDLESTNHQSPNIAGAAAAAAVEGGESGEYVHIRSTTATKGSPICGASSMSNSIGATKDASSSSSSNGQSTSAPNVSGSNSSVWWPWRFASGTSTATINMTRGTKAKPSN